MAEDHVQASHNWDQMRAITVSREYGSGGGEIARRLANRLNWRLVDHEIVIQVARELQISEADAAEYDERGEGIIARILSSLQTIDQMLPATSPLIVSDDIPSYQAALNRVVKSAYQEGHVVIVGRGSQALLGARHDAFHLRIIAPLEQRIQYVMQREGMSQEDAKNRIRLKERDRQRYLQDAYKQHPDDPQLYDLVINTAVLDLDSVVDLVLFTLDRKALRLNVPQEELGPGAGLPRYPTQPGDFRITNDPLEPQNQA